MDARSLIVGAGLLLVGFLIGRASAMLERSRMTYEPPPDRRPRPSIEMTDVGNAEIAALLRAGKKIEAIKLHRDLYGTGLKEAKDAIDAWDLPRLH